MSRAYAPLAGVLLALLAGCNGLAPPADLQPDWNSGPQLHAMSVANTEGDLLANLDHGDVARPVSCRAYRDARPIPQDTCQIRDPEQGESAPWVAQAHWAAGVPGWDRPYETRVVAYDQTGHPVAWWAGQLSNDTVADVPH